MTVPAIKLVAWQDRDPHFIFVGVPDERGRYLRTDPSVALVSCPNCHAAVGEPCKGNGGKYGGTTHVSRRQANYKNWGHRAFDVLLTPSPVPDEWMESSA